MTEQVVKAPEQKKQPAAWVPVVLIGLRLLLICAVVAGIVSLVYSVTKPKAEENLRATKSAAIAEIFGTNDLTFEESATDAGFYTVHYGEGHTAIGYCVESTSGGFGGDLTLMVGFDPDGTIKGVSVVSHSETPGLGARVKTDADYLTQYNGKSGKLTLKKDGGNDVDAISGATISSRAVLTAVNAATERLQTFLAGGDAQ